MQLPRLRPCLESVGRLTLMAKIPDRLAFVIAHLGAARVATPKNLAPRSGERSSLPDFRRGGEFPKPYVLVFEKHQPWQWVRSASHIPDCHQLQTANCSHSWPFFFKCRCLQRIFQHLCGLRLFWLAALWASFCSLNGVSRCFSVPAVHWLGIAQSYKSTAYKRTDRAFFRMPGTKSDWNQIFD